MTTEQSRAVVQRWIDTWQLDGKGAVDQADLFLAPSFVHHFDTGMECDRARYLEMFGHFYDAFPDLEYIPQDMVAEGDKVVVRYDCRGTHNGAPFLGAKPSGEEITFSSTYMYRLADGLIQEDWESWDGLRFNMTLGFVKPGAEPQMP